MRSRSVPYEMHRTAEYGIAAHWKYKESGGSNEQNVEGKNSAEAKLYLAPSDPGVAA